MVDKPIGKNVVGTKWIYKVKYYADGIVEKYKARLVAKGYAQEKGIDYEEAFSLVAKMTTIRSVISLAANYGWPVFHMNVKSAFLNGDLKEEVYVQQSQGFEVQRQKHKVCKLQKALYGIKQAPRAWYHKIHK